MEVCFIKQIIYVNLGKKHFPHNNAETGQVSVRSQECLCFSVILVCLLPVFFSMFLKSSDRGPG